MIYGSGPGRGMPWWYRRLILTLRWAPADSGTPGVGISRLEPVGRKREGRTVAVVNVRDGER